MVTQHFNNLTPAEAERLAILFEECSEVIQAVGKILRHGYGSCHPTGGPDNRHALEIEVGDLLAAVDIMTHANADLDIKAIEEAQHSKLQRIGKYLHHQS